jgi:uncharacterized membrane protein YhaH (DUF805 family)
MNNLKENRRVFKLGGTITRKYFLINLLELLVMTLAMSCVIVYLFSAIDVLFPSDSPQYYLIMGIKYSWIPFATLSPFWLSNHYKRMRDIRGSEKYKNIYQVAITILLLNPFFFLFVELVFLLLPGKNHISRDSIQKNNFLL